MWLLLLLQQDQELVFLKLHILVHFQVRQCCQNCFTSLLKRGSTLKGKNLLPVSFLPGSKFFHFRTDPFTEGILCAGKQTEICKSCLRCKKWWMINQMYTVSRLHIPQNRHFIIQERFNKLIYGINTIIKSSTRQPVKFQSPVLKMKLEQCFQRKKYIPQLF